MKRFASSRRRGVAAVEFAFLLLPLVLMIFGTTEIGRAIYTYNTLDKAVRDAARHLSRNGAGDAAVQAEARCLAIYGNTGCSGAPLAPGLGTRNVVLCDALSCPSTHAAQSTGLGAVNLVTVSIQSYAYDSAAEFVMPDLAFNNISVTMRSQL